MRFPTPNQQAKLDLDARSTHLRVSVALRGTTDFVNLSDLEGFNWVKAVSYSDDIDTPISRCKISLWRRNNDLNLSPFVYDSKLNQNGILVDVGNHIKVDVAIVGKLQIPIDSPLTIINDWVEVFRGQIETLDWSKQIIQVSCADQGMELQQIFIETLQVYGNTPPATTLKAEDVIQDILDDHVNTPGLGVLGTVNLYSPLGSVGTPYNPTESTNWAVKEYVQRKDSVLNAIRNIAIQIGWDLRYRWQGITESFELVLYEPRRTGGSTITLDPDEYYEVNQLAISRKDVRNSIKGIYLRTSDGTRQEVIVQSAASIARYGKKACEFAEASSSQIDTSVEANALVAAALSDLRDPRAIQSVTLPYLWNLELNDEVIYSSNKVHYDDDGLTFRMPSSAITGLSHTLEAGSSAKSTILTRGLPTSGHKNWLDREGRPGVGSEINKRDLAEADNLTTVVGQGTATVIYDDPRAMSPPINDWGTTRVYSSTTPGFTPTSSNLIAQGKQTRFEITDLTPGVIYYFKIDIIDNAGNSAATITQEVSAVPLKTTAVHIDPDDLRNSLIRNATFGQVTVDLTQVPPDGWSVGGLQNWGPGQDMEDNTIYSDSGGRSIQYNGFNLTDLVSELIPIKFNRYYRWETALRAQNLLGVGQESMRFRFDLFDKDKFLVGSTSRVLSATPEDGNFHEKTGWVQAFTANAKFLQITYGFGSRPPGVETQYWIDRIEFNETLEKSNVTHSATAVPVGGGWTILPAVPDTTKSIGTRYNVGTSTFDVLEAGVYNVVGSITFAAVPAGVTVALALQESSGATVLTFLLGNQTPGAAANVTLQVAHQFNAIAGEKYAIYAMHNHVAPISLTGATTDCTVEYEKIAKAVT